MNSLFTWHLKCLPERWFYFENLISHLLTKSQKQLIQMVFNNILYNLSFSLILFLSHVNVCHAGIGAISAAAAGGANSVFGKNRVARPRPEEGQIDVFIKVILGGAVGAILLVGSAVYGYKMIIYCKKKGEDVEKAEGSEKVKCKLGKKMSKSLSTRNN